MQGRRGEELYREHRPASRDATFVEGARDDLEGMGTPSRAKRMGRTSTAPPGISRDEAVARGTALDPLQKCPYGPDCQLHHNEAHMQRFQHECKFQDFCTKKRDKEHCRLFSHVADVVDSGAHADGDGQEGGLAKRGWLAEKDTVAVLPSRSASAYSKVNPPLSACPRFRFRPQGGSTMPTELAQLSRKEAPARDVVSLVFEGISTAWDRQGFATYVRDHCGFKVPIFDAKVFLYRGHPTGSGRLVVGTYEDAAAVVKAFDGTERGAHVVKVRYENPVCAPEQGAWVPSTDDKKGISRKMINLSVRQFNNSIRDCGPYAMDALALKERMAMEGHEADSITYTRLIKTFRDNQPPLPQKAEALVREMIAKGMQPTALQCNLVVDAYTRTGNMRLAEKFADEMDPLSRARDPKVPIAMANFDTYQILSDGWSSVGAAEQIKDRQQLVGWMKKNKKDRICVPGAHEPAKSTIALWGRKKSGYLPLSTGIIAPDDDHRVPWHNVIMNKWRSKF